MKRCAILLALELLMTGLCPALASDFSDFEDFFDFYDSFGGGDEGAALPDWEEPAEGAANTIRIDLNGRNLNMDFDASPDYSMVENGMVQASFFTYTDDPEVLYELYLTFPDGVQAGMSITPDYAISNASDCSVVLIVSDTSNEHYYFSGQIGDAIYPEDTHYDIRFDSVTPSEYGDIYTGTLSATLVAVDMASGKPEDKLAFIDAPFTFTMPDTAAPQETPAPDDDADFFDEPTLRPDMYRV